MPSFLYLRTNKRLFENINQVPLSSRTNKNIKHHLLTEILIFVIYTNFSKYPTQAYS